MRTIKALFGLALVVVGVYVAYKLIPPYFNNYQLQDVLENEARMNSYSGIQKSEDDIRNVIIRKAQDLDVPLTPEQVKITRAGTDWVITTDYTIHVDLPVYPMDLQFHASSKK
jgi:hypothetical protein